MKGLLPIHCIVAVTHDKFGMANKGFMPWSLPNEFKYFLSVSSKTFDKSKKNALIMGRNTWETLPKKPLPKRINVILTSNPSKIESEFGDEVKAGDLLCFDSFEKAVSHLNKNSKKVERIFACGGPGVYQLALDHPQTTRVYLTKIYKNYECDTFFPKFESWNEKFKLDTEYQPFKEGVHVENDVPYQFCMYQKPHEEYQYLNMVEKILKEGITKGDRTGVGTKSLFGNSMRFSLRNGTFPLLTTKKVFLKGVVEELLWFIKGQTNAKILQDKGVHIWDGNSTREYLDSIGLKDNVVGDCGPIYGFQWRHWGADYTTMEADYTGKGIDQLSKLIETLKNNPNDRRMILSAWNIAAIPKMALPPCHILAQFYVANGELSCQMYQRSCDMGLGVPFNIASYSLLTIMLAQVCGYKPGEFIHVLGDTHVYLNHIKALEEQITREPRDFPKISLNPEIKNIEDFKIEDITVTDYNPHPTIAMDMAV